MLGWALLGIVCAAGLAFCLLSGSLPSQEVPLPPPDDPALEPWRKHTRAGSVGLMPLNLVLMLIPAWKLTSVERLEQERCTALAASITAEGIKVPLEVKVDQNGLTTLHNGTHRAIVCWRLGYTHLPVTVEPATRLKTFSQPASAVIDTLAKAMNEDRGL